MTSRRAAILAVGSELLTPTRQDTNSLAITEVLNALGIEVAVKAIVGDQRDDLAAHVQMAVSRHPVVVITGGLGPTDDDLTRDVVAGVLGRRLLEDPAGPEDRGQGRVGAARSIRGIDAEGGHHALRFAEAIGSDLGPLALLEARYRTTHMPTWAFRGI